MSYTTSWYTPNKILYLELHERPERYELVQINEYIMKIISEHEGQLHLVFNIGNLKSGYNTSNDLQETQKYMDHRKMGQVYFVSSNKLNRLITVLAFSLSRATLLQFDTINNVAIYLRQQGFESAIMI